jgi:hypothetical protein
MCVMGRSQNLSAQENVFDPEFSAMIDIFEKNLKLTHVLIGVDHAQVQPPEHLRHVWKGEAAAAGIWLFVAAIQMNKEPSGRQLSFSATKSKD